MNSSQNQGYRRGHGHTCQDFFFWWAQLWGRVVGRPSELCGVISVQTPGPAWGSSESPSGQRTPALSAFSLVGHGTGGARSPAVGASLSPGLAFLFLKLPRCRNPAQSILMYGASKPVWG